MQGISKTSSSTQTDQSVVDNLTAPKIYEQNKKDSYTQISETYCNDTSKEKSVENYEISPSKSWVVNSNSDKEKSIAEQVKEVAQTTLQESGMVFVESAGMYYDYKTGYYYNSVSNLKFSLKFII